MADDRCAIHLLTSIGVSGVNFAAIVTCLMTLLTWK